MAPQAARDSASPPVIGRAAPSRSQLPLAAAAGRRQPDAPAAAQPAAAPARRFRCGSASRLEGSNAKALKSTVAATA